MSWNSHISGLVWTIETWNIDKIPSTSQSQASMIIFVIVGIGIWVLVWWLFAKIYFLQQRNSDRKLAIKQSKSTTLWYVSEKIAPLLPNFPYSYKDLVFLWKWVDYICFDGLSEGEVKQVVLIEIKTWKSQLNKNEAMIKTAIDKWKVSRETIRL